MTFTSIFTGVKLETGFNSNPKVLEKGRIASLLNLKLSVNADKVFIVSNCCLKLILLITLFCLKDFFF